ncbi:MAG: hypothetical protein CMH44_17015 [Muricauda sp.]|nr:hypothetical protein [Allomuricauda sp.]MBC72257.1 hypothetical protein [Allomuricauda sp.]MBC72926.1 hypothetical protein [Allomuricauda sp.]
MSLGSTFSGPFFISKKNLKKSKPVQLFLRKYRKLLTKYVVIKEKKVLGWVILVTEGSAFL